MEMRNIIVAGLKSGFVITMAAPAIMYAGWVYGPDIQAAIPACTFPIQRVVDGDTVECEHRYVRLVGCDTPEPMAMNANKQCRAREMALGRKATNELRNAFEAGKLTVEPIGKKGKRRRPLAKFYIDGQNACTVLAKKGLAKTWYAVKAKPDWCNGEG